MSAANTLPPLEVGDIAPRFTLTEPATGAAFDSHQDEASGRPLILAFVGSPSEPIAAQLLARRQAFEALGALAFVVARRPDQQAGVLGDAEGAMSRHFAGKGSGLVTIGRNGHALQRVQTNEPAAVDRTYDLLSALASEAAPRPAERQAPVLIVPNVLSAADCKRLITVFNMDGNVFVEPGHGVQNRKTDYKMRIPDNGRKDRIDHWVVNPQTMGLINDRLQRRLFPEIQKAFQYKITRHERYRIGSYEGERGGDLNGHRDNTQPNVVHRRFACSINLNAEDFEGGELAFPEFGGHRFSPRTGEAVVFSSSLLHEPLHITKGRRLVLLAFLFGET
jgi:predicted 2-oxoglutarate/Fe(II)-dependent dioxygenase YbiX